MKTPIHKLIWDASRAPHRSGPSLIRVLLYATVLLTSFIKPALAEIIPPGCFGNGYGIALFVDKPRARVGDQLVYSLGLSNEPFPACRAEQITAALVTPDGVTNRIALRRTVLNPGESDGYPDVVTYVIRQQDVKDGLVRAAAISSAVINQNVINESSENFRDVNTVLVTPCINIVATCLGSVGEGGPITFTGTARNCGNIMLTGVTITSLADGVTRTVIGPVNLDPGQELPFTGSFVPSNPCAPATATLTVTGADPLVPPKTVTASTSVTCSNTLTPGIALTTECVPGPVSPGQALPYRGTVRNSGNVTLTNVVVLADKPAANTVVFGPARLAPGEAAQFTGNYAAPAGCSSTVLFSTSARSLCNQPVSANSNITCQIASQPVVTITSSCPATLPAPGNLLSYTGTVANGGNVLLQNIRVFSQQTPGSPIFTAPSLAPGASVNFSGSFGTPANACSVSDTLTVIGQDACSNLNITNLVTTTCNLTVNPRIEVTQQCPPTAPAAGAPLNYSGTVRNTGNVALTDVTVVSDLPAPNTIVFTAATLAPGATASFTGSFTAPLDVCSVANSLAATGRDSCGGTAVAANIRTVCPVGTTPRIVLTRTCPPVPPIGGTALAYTGTVQNTGNVTLTNVVVMSDRPVANTVVFSAPTLAPGATLSFNGSFLTPVDACSVTDILTVTSRDQCSGQVVSDTRTTVCPLAAAGQIRLAVVCPTAPATAGGTITLTGTVTNPGNVTLTNVVVINDSAPATPVFMVASLAPQASASFTASVPAPANACSVAASFTASAADRCGTSSVRDVVSVTCTAVNNPAIVVTHECPTTPLAFGQTGTFAGTVRNSGNVTLNNVTVRNADTTVFGPAVLVPGATANFTGTFTVPADTCSVTSTVTASGADQCDGRVVSNTSTKNCPVSSAPRLVLTSTCPTSPVAAGGQITFGGTLQNAGNVTLTDIVVNRGNNRVFGPVTLAPGATSNFTVTSTVPGNLCSFTEAWTATGRDKCSNAAVTDSTSITCPLLTAPKIRLTLSCPSGQAAPGASVRYNGSILNEGNITLTNIVVINSSAPATPVFSAASLAPGATATFSADVAVPSNACTVSASMTVSAAGQCQGSVTDTASASCPVATSPQVAITHDCPTQTSMPGQASGFSGRVTNSGNVTLTNVVVLHALAGTSPVFGPATLAPGQTADFTGSYTIPSTISGCTYESRVTVTAADNCSGRAVTAEHRTSCTLEYLPGLQITILCPETLSAQGDRFYYRAIIKNVGNVRLDNINVTDTHHGEQSVWSRDSLSVGESHEMGNFAIVPDDCCTITTTLRATAVDSCTRKPIVDTSTRTCPIRFNPQIAVTKECPTRPVMVGETSFFQGTVSNPGNVTLVDVNVVTSASGQPVRLLGPIALAPGQVVNYKTSYVVSGDLCGQDVVTATGRSFCSEDVVSASANTKCQVETMPMLMVTKNCPTLPTAHGDMFNYSGTVLNAGNVTLTDVFVFNSRPTTGTQLLGPITLAPGESRNFTGSYKLNVPCCDTWDTLTVRGRDKCTGKTVENSDTVVCPVLWTPRIEVTKQCRSNTGAFTGLVRNTGDVTLTNVTVMIEGSTTQLLGAIELAPGETKTFAGTGTGDAVLDARGISLCGKLAVRSRANCTGTLPDALLAIHDLELKAGEVAVRWQSIPGRFYRVEYKTRAESPEWQALPGEVQATEAISQKLDAPADGGQRFYRVRMLE